MSVRQSAELDHAFQRNGWTAADVKKLSQGRTLADVLRLIKGELKLVEATPHESPIWKTVKLGTCKTPEQYRATLSLANRSLTLGADEALDEVSCMEAEMDLDLVLLSVKELGFKISASYREVCAKATELGLELCPAEVGPALRLQYNDQPVGERLLIAMKAVVASQDSHSKIFCLESRPHHSLWLSVDVGHLQDLWPPFYRFVFVRRK
jgi:hypothetical protein